MIVRKRGDKRSFFENEKIRKYEQTL